MLILRAFVLGLLFCSNLYADIRQTADLQAIKREIFASPKDTLVVFDVDLVLIKPSDEIFLLSEATAEGSAFINTVYANLANRLPKHDIDEMQSILMLAQHWQPVTAETPKIFNQIKAKGYKVLGLTASGTGALGKIRSLEQWRIDELKAIDITFDKDFINAKPGSLDKYIPRISEYYGKAIHPCFPAANNGIIFTCMAPKGEALDAYLQYAKLKPKKIIFIDDRIKNLETVSEYCSQNNIQYIGYEYTVSKEQAKHMKFNERRAKLQYKVLEIARTWLNEPQADAVLAEIDKASTK